MPRRFIGVNVIYNKYWPIFTDYVGANINPFCSQVLAGFAARGAGDDEGKDPEVPQAGGLTDVASSPELRPEPGPAPHTRRDDEPLLHIVDGELVVTEKRGALAGLLHWFGEPMRSAWHHRDLIMAILRRELSERFKGSVGRLGVGGRGAVAGARHLHLRLRRRGRSCPTRSSPTSQIDYALFIFGGLIVFNFFSEMAFRAPSLLHEYAHYIKQTMFPAEMLPMISTLRATVYPLIGLVVMLLCQLIFTGTLPWTVLLLPLWLHPVPGLPDRHDLVPVGAGRLHARRRPT